LESISGEDNYLHITFEDRRGGAGEGWEYFQLCFAADISIQWLPEKKKSQRGASPGLKKNKRENDKTFGGRRRAEGCPFRVSRNRKEARNYA